MNMGTNQGYISVFAVTFGTMCSGSLVTEDNNHFTYLETKVWSLRDFRMG